MTMLLQQSLLKRVSLIYCLPCLLSFSLFVFSGYPEGSILSVFCRVEIDATMISETAIRSPEPRYRSSQFDAISSHPQPGV